MNVFFPFCKKDIARAQEWLQWCSELGFQRHTIYLHPAAEFQGCPPHIEQLARKAFERVEIIPDREGAEGWPEGPNACFRQAAWFFNGKKEDWLFMENDCWPLCEGWLDSIESEWKRVSVQGKFFMGDLVPGGNGYAEHMSGNAVWSWRTPEFSAKMMLAVNGAFDIVDPGPIVAAMHRTELIQDVFCFPPPKDGQPGQPPSFRDMASLAIIRPSAVLFHRNKDNTLHRRLREKLRGVQVPQIPQPEPCANIKHRVCTYFEEVPGIGAAAQAWLLARWSFAWKEAGFSPMILNRSHAEQNPGFAELNAKFEALPSVNPAGYDAACYRRYLAMVTVSGGIMCDYDVMPYGLSPDELDKLSVSREVSRFPLLLADNNPCPCAMIGNAKQYESAAVEFATRGQECVYQEQGKPHVSDQACVQKWKWPALDLCYEMGREGWLTAKMVHYAHSVCGGRPRSEVIPAAEKLRLESLQCVPVEVAFKDDPRFPQFAFNANGHTVEAGTWIEGIRSRVLHLRTESEMSDNNRTRIMKELKASGLTPGGFKYGPKKKKRRKRQLAKA